MTLATHFKKFLNIVYKNYRGQVAIFVALIFQVVFILFALMINVGLLVHHKINLQQSTDLAAYYGAMKQSEMLNVVSHVNFQIRQAYKLLTWRYRILGTFGIQKQAAADAIQYPINHSGGGPLSYNPQSESPSCSDNLGPTDVPFMCLGHYGFKEYESPPNSTETFCKANCGHYAGAKTTISQINTGATGGAGIWDVFDIGNFNGAIIAANDKLDKACNGNGPVTMAQLAKFYLSYLQEVHNRMLFIKMMMVNLSAEEKEQLDLEGNKVIDGVTATFKNNLTEANNSSFGKDENIFETMNSLSPTHGGECSYGRITNVKKPEGDSSVGLFAEINFAFIQYFITRCQLVGTQRDRNFQALSIYDLAQIPNLDTTLYNQIKTMINSTAADRVKQIMGQNDSDHTLGIEKNPWCGVYYGVKATSTPVIPFLPISKIKLHASSFAQPFGGSVGPRAYKEWIPSSNRSDPTGGVNTQTDRVMPTQNPLAMGPINTLKDNMKIMLNYSNYVGDNKGLADAKIVGVYHDMLLNRSVANDAQPQPTSYSKSVETSRQDNRKPDVWPAYAEWNNLTVDISKPEYDPVAHAENNQNSFMRDIELSVVAPNQFEITYYSIEPDFYNVYVKDKLEKGFDKLKSQAGLSGTKVYLPKDFGHNDQLSGIPKKFSVRDQLAVVQHVMRAGNSNSPPTLTSYNFSGGSHSQGMSALSASYFNYIPFLPGSLLTSWTMKDLVSDDYALVTQDGTKMPFAQCLDEDDIQGRSGYESIAGQNDPKGGSEKLPPAPGNCITGGRTGYSVKIVSPHSLFGERLLLGGSATGSLRNPPTGFVSF